jgi:hypothetical protein
MWLWLRKKPCGRIRAMIEFRTLSDDNPDLAHSPLLRAALLTLQYAQERGAIGLTKRNAFKRVFVHWAAEHFDWPGQSAEEMFRFCKIINEYDFEPLDLLHYLFITLRLGRHVKGEFRLTKRGADLARAPGRLFSELVPFFILDIDHASSAGFEQRLLGNWDLWLNVINAEADHGADERALFATFYGKAPDFPNEGWQDMHAFSACVMRPLDWAGLLVRTPDIREGRHGHHVFKTPLWRSALKLDTDAMLRPVSVQ